MEIFGTSPGVFIGLTIVLVGGAAMLSGQAIAHNWQPAWLVVPAGLGLGLADRFLTFALFEGELLNLPGFIMHSAVLIAMAFLAWRLTHVGKMCRQYPWRFERRSLFAYAPRSPDPTA